MDCFYLQCNFLHKKRNDSVITAYMKTKAFILIRMMMMMMMMMPTTTMMAVVVIRLSMDTPSPGYLGLPCPPE